MFIRATAEARSRPAGRYGWIWVIPPACLIAAVCASALAAPHLPERMPTHWGFDGRPTNLMPRGFALWALPALMVWSAFLVWAITWSASLNRGQRDVPAWISPAVTAATTGIVLVMHLGLIGVGLGWGVSIPAISNLAIGMLYLAMGYAMGRVPPNHLFGVRTARTLACPDTWERANRTGGRWMMAAGIVTMLAAPLPGGWPMAVLLGSVVAACVASLVATRADRAADPGANTGAEAGVDLQP